MIKLSVTLTSSKIFAFIALIIGSVYAFMFKDPVVIMTTITASSALFSIKSGIEAMKK